MKSENIIQGVIHSPEALASAVGETARLKVEHAAALSEMELEIAAVQKRHQPRLLALGRQIALREAGVFTYCQQHRETLFGAKRSLDLLPGTIGFRTTPPRVERVNSKDQWSTVALRLAALEWGRDYLHDALPEVNKERLLAHRHKLTAEQLAQAGLKFEQDENFFITPGSEQTAPTTIRQAA